MGITFRTVDELVSILESRGVKTDERTAAAIERESYYAIINGYKGPFLDLQKMESSSDDVYKNGTEFQWIYDLFMFDRDLRFLTFKYLTRAEAIMRTAVAYAFAESHPEKNAYLDRANFCTKKDFLVPEAFRGNKYELYEKNLDRLMKTLHGKVALSKNTHDFIKHYVKKYSSVPLWVLSNDLTFGNIVHFYQLMQVNDRRKVCKIVADVSKRDKRRGALTERRLLRAANILNDFRNLCAHDERLYCAKFGNDGFSTMTVLMIELIPIPEVNEFLEDLNGLFNEYGGRLHGVSPTDLVAEMGFPKPI